MASAGSGVVKASGRLKTLALGVWDSRVCSKTFLVLGRTMYGDLFNPACYLIRNAILSGELCFSPTNLGIALMRFTIGVRLGKGISSNGSLANLDWLGVRDAMFICGFGRSAWSKRIFEIGLTLWTSEISWSPGLEIGLTFLTSYVSSRPRFVY